MAKHTEGPWVINFEDANGLKNAVCHVESGIQTICRVSLPFPFDTNYDERDANARLIAAAPEMLDVLQAEEEWQARDLAGAIDPEWDYETMVGTKRRAAIKRAMGDDDASR